MPRRTLRSASPDWAAAGLEGFGRPTGYLEWQLRRFGGLWEQHRTRPLPAVERVGAWLADNLPQTVGYLCMMWSQTGDPETSSSALTQVTRAGGFLTREQLAARYEERSGHSMRDVRWYSVLALWKAIVFMESNYGRALAAPPTTRS